MFLLVLFMEFLKKHCLEIPPTISWRIHLATFFKRFIQDFFWCFTNSRTENSICKCILGIIKKSDALQDLQEESQNELLEECRNLWKNPGKCKQIGKYKEIEGSDGFLERFLWGFWRYLKNKTFQDYSKNPFGIYQTFWPAFPYTPYRNISYHKNRILNKFPHWNLPQFHEILLHLLKPHKNSINPYSSSRNSWRNPFEELSNES